MPARPRRQRRRDVPPSRSGQRGQGPRWRQEAHAHFSQRAATARRRVLVGYYVPRSLSGAQQGGKYSVSDWMNPKFNNDGSLTIYMQPMSPGSDPLADSAHASLLAARSGSRRHMVSSACGGSNVALPALIAQSPWRKSAVIERHARTVQAPIAGAESRPSAFPP
jgi:hypothetical protein